MSTQLATIDRNTDRRDVSTSAMVFDPQTLASMQQMAEAMATARVTIPKHLAGSKGDCLAVVMQAMQWGMNPFSIAQKTHLVQGTLGYEAQLVNAVISSSAALASRPNYEWFGPWEKVVGKFKAIKRKNNEGREYEYRTPDWSASDEEGCGVRVWATIKGEPKPRELELLLTQSRTRNSTLWADDPRQQLAYLAIKRWARLHAPDVLLGVYTPDELEQTERDMGTAQIIQDPEPTGSRTESVKAKLASRKPKPAAQPEPTVSLDAVLSAITAAVDLDALKAAGEQAKPLQGDDRETALAAYKARQTELKQQPQDDEAARIEASLIEAAKTAKTDDERAEILDVARELSEEARDRITAAFPAA
jgi:hypothetical protein